MSLDAARTSACATSESSTGLDARDGPRNGDHHDGPDHVVPKIGDGREARDGEHGELTGYNSPKRGPAPGALHEKRDGEHAEHAAVEQRSHLIHRLDQCSEIRREIREND